MSTVERDRTNENSATQRRFRFVPFVLKYVPTTRWRKSNSLGLSSADDSNAGEQRSIFTIVLPGWTCAGEETAWPDAIGRSMCRTQSLVRSLSSTNLVSPVVVNQAGMQKSRIGLVRTSAEKKSHRALKRIRCVQVQVKVTKTSWSIPALRNWSN